MGMGFRHGRLLRVSYFSNACARFDRADLNDIMRRAVQFNREHLITGVLLFNGRNFMQVLEGPGDLVQDLYGAIQADERHFGVTTLSSGEIGGYTYPSWGMNLKRLSAEMRRNEFKMMEQELANALVDLSTPATRRMIENFMRLG